MAEREVRDIMYLPLHAIIKTMQAKLGFKALPDGYTEEACMLALKRNCIARDMDDESVVVRSKVSPKSTKGKGR